MFCFCVTFENIVSEGKKPPKQTTDIWSLCLLPSANHMFQYFITIVPTKLNTYRVSAETHQYSVTEQVGLNL